MICSKKYVALHAEDPRLAMERCFAVECRAGTFQIAARRKRQATIYITGPQVDESSRCFSLTMFNLVALHQFLPKRVAEQNPPAAVCNTAQHRAELHRVVSTSHQRTLPTCITNKSASHGACARSECSITRTNKLQGTHAMLVPPVACC